MMPFQTLSYTADTSLSACNQLKKARAHSNQTSSIATASPQLRNLLFQHGSCPVPQRMRALAIRQLLL